MRIRTIKPEFFTHEGLYELEKETKLPIRVAFAGLWCVADKAGRFKWEPRRIGIAILPYDGIEFSRVLDALLTRGFVVKYTSGTCDYGWIPSFKRHNLSTTRKKSQSCRSIQKALKENWLTRVTRVRHALMSRAIGKGKVRGMGMIKGTESHPKNPPRRASASRVLRMKCSPNSGISTLAESGKPAQRRRGKNSNARKTTRRS